MKKEDIHLWDWKRLMIGEVPLEFMLETLLRTIVVYLFLLFILRLLGKRMNAQLTLTEMAVMITLGAIVSPAMQLPDRGILPAMVILCCILLFQRGLGQLSFKYRRVELLTQGDVSLMVKNGVLQVEEMAKSKVSKSQLFGALRTHKIKHLGEVRRAYLESGGFFSVFKAAEPQPGLAILPEKDPQLPQPAAQNHDILVCENCGFKTSFRPDFKEMDCPECRHQKWTYPIQ